MSYAYATIEDRIDGRQVPRSIDQPHTLKLNVSYRTPWQWDLSFAWELHSGWPTTAVTAQQVEGEDGEQIVPVLGPLYGERLSDYHRLDLRASRRFDLRRGELELYFAVQNLTNVGNVRGFEVAFEDPAGGQVQVQTDEKLWARLLPSLGIRWTF